MTDEPKRPFELWLERKTLTDRSTIGELTIDGDWTCYTLEDRLRRDGSKVPGRTCIPAGRYRIIISFSQRFKQHMPLLLSVPNFTGIRIHSGNTDADTDGCILVGCKPGKDMVSESRKAFKPLFDEIVDAITLEQREVWITIINPTIINF